MMPSFRRRTKYYWKTKEKGCICCRFPHSSRPVSLDVGGTEQQVDHDDFAAVRNDSCKNDGDHVHVAHEPESQHEGTCPLADGGCSCTTFTMKRKKLKPSVARQAAAIATRRAQVVAGHFTAAVRDAALQTVALVEREEINCGNLLGVGGFSVVYVVESVDLQLTSIEHDLYGGQVSMQCRLIGGRSHLYREDKQSKRRRVLAQKASSPRFQDASRQSKEGEQQTAKNLETSDPCADTIPEEVIKEATHSQERVHGLSQYGCDEEGSRVTSRHRNSGRATTSTSDRSRYAIKHLKPELMNFPEKFAKAASDLAGEAEFLLCLDHPHIVKLHGLPWFGSSAYRCGEHHAFFFIMDRMVETLHDRVNIWREMVHESLPSKEFKKSSMGARVPHFFNRWFPLARLRTRSTERNNPGKETPSSLNMQEQLCGLFLGRIRVANDVASAIQHIHDRRIIHRDIKTTNIGFDHYGVVKVFDFGLARHLPEPTTTTAGIDECFCMSNVGTKRYSAPEVSQKRYNLKSDVYSFGVVLWEILTLNSPRKPPRQSAVSGALLDTQKLRSCPCWPITIQRLVFEMQNQDYRQRPTISSVRMTLSSFLQRMAHQPMMDCGSMAVRQGSSRKSINSVDSTNILDERRKSIRSRSAAALIEDQETALSSSLMGMSVSPTYQ